MAFDISTARPVGAPTPQAGPLPTPQPEAPPEFGTAATHGRIMDGKVQPALPEFGSGGLLS